MAGYYSSEHRFGNSAIKRSGSFFYLMWQSRKETDITKVMIITKMQYELIKMLLGPLVKTTEPKLGHIVYIHKATKPSYYRIKKLIKYLEDLNS